MALSDDQRAMLRLLAQREQGYDDLAALMGLSVDEVRAKVKDALARLEEEGKTPPPAPAEVAPASEAPVTAPELEPPLEVLAAEPPPPPEASRPATPARSHPQPPKSRPRSSKSPQTEPVGTARPRISIPSSNRVRAAIAAGALALVALIVVLLVGGGGDSSDTTSAGSEGSANAAEEAASTTAANGKEITQAILSPVDGGNAKGVAAFGRVKNSLALQIEATGLQPTAKGQSYAVWLYESPQKMLPLATTQVGKSGKIAAQVEVPTEVLAYLANEAFDQIDISLTSTATLKAALAKATREKKAPAYTGTDVLRGKITGPIIGAAKK